MNEQRLFDLKDTALYLHSLGAKSVTIGFVRELVNSGALPYLRIGKKFYVSKAALDNWLVKAERRARP
jgi:excisionase family DNA binding protein